MGVFFHFSAFLLLIYSIFAVISNVLIFLTGLVLQLWFFNSSGDQDIVDMLEFLKELGYVIAMIQAL